MNWEERPLEKYVQLHIKKELRSEGESLWLKYSSTRLELLDSIIPWISSVEPNLTDHGCMHIRNVIDNAALLLGFQNHFCEEEVKHGLTSHELILLLMGLLLHDVGNIYGRDRHFEKIEEVWSKLNSWRLWGPPERNMITTVGRAHSGTANNGSKDTIKPLVMASSSSYFIKSRVRLASIAAIIRFADELAEGPQRTSKFLIENKCFSDDSNIFHQYSQVTNIAIDREGGRIALTYYIDIDNEAYPSDVNLFKKHISKLLEMIYARAMKLNYERQLARYYAEMLSPFRETSVSIIFQENGITIDIPWKPIVLDDISTLGEKEKLIEQQGEDYRIPNLVEKIAEVKHG